MFVCEFEIHRTPTERYHPEFTSTSLSGWVSLSLDESLWWWLHGSLGNNIINHAIMPIHPPHNSDEWLTLHQMIHHFIIIVSGWKDVGISPTWVTWNTVASCVPNLKKTKVLDEVAMAIIHPDCKHLQSGFATCPALTSLKIAFFFSTLLKLLKTDVWKTTPRKG